MLILIVVSDVRILSPVESSARAVINHFRRTYRPLFFEELRNDSSSTAISTFNLDPI